MRIQRVSSKWAKTKVILKNRPLAIYIPETRKYNLTALSEMLGTYGTVYIKPDRGTYGNGVMRAEQRTASLSPSSQHTYAGDHGTAPEGAETEQKVMYVLRYGIEGEAFSTVEELHAALIPRMKERSYLIQQGIDLLRHEDRPFDLRVLTQKNLKGEWETTGMLGRIAAPQKIVTNYHNGGSVLSVHALFSEHMSPGERAATIQSLKSLGVKIAAQLETAYPGIKEIGLDIALDQHHDIWLLEVNTLPSIIAFKLVHDKSVYRRIHRYAVAYGRMKKSKPALASRRK